MSEIYYKLILPVDMALLFIAGFLFTAGHILIELLYDHRYKDAGGFLEILSISLIAVRYGVAHQLYLAIGKPKWMAMINFLRFLSLLVLVPLFFNFYGLMGAIWGISLHNISTVPLVYYFNRICGITNLKKEFRSFALLPLGAGVGWIISQCFMRVNG